MPVEHGQVLSAKGCMCSAQLSAVMLSRHSHSTCKGMGRVSHMLCSQGILAWGCARPRGHLAGTGPTALMCFACHRLHRSVLMCWNRVPISRGSLVWPVCHTTQHAAVQALGVFVSGECHCFVFFTGHYLRACGCVSTCVYFGVGEGAMLSRWRKGCVSVCTWGWGWGRGPRVMF